MRSKNGQLLAMVAAVIAATAPMPPLQFEEPLKLTPGNKGRSNNKPGARAKDRARTKAAHKQRVAQKRKKRKK